MKYYFCQFQDSVPTLKIMAFVQQLKRHHNKDDVQSSGKAAKPLSTVVLLERLHRFGAIIDGDTNIFANQACSALHGYRLQAKSELAFEDNFAGTQINKSLRPATYARAEQIVGLVRCEGGHAGQDPRGSLSRHKCRNTRITPTATEASSDGKKLSDFINTPNGSTVAA